VSRYFFVCSALPELFKTEAPEISLDAIRMLFDLNLSKPALAQVYLAQAWTDLTNVQSLLYGVPLEIFGNLNPKEIEADLENNLGFFDFVLEFRNHFETVDLQKKHFAKLYFQFFENMRDKAQGFLHWYYSFLEEVFIVTTSLRAKKAGRDIDKEFSWREESFSSKTDVNIQESSGVYADLQKVYEENFEEPEKQHKQFLSFLFDRIEEKKEELSWGLDWLIAYLIQVQLLSKMHPTSSQSFDILEQIGERAS